MIALLCFLLGVVTQEGEPSLGRWPGSLDHVLRDAGLSDLKAELEQLAMDAWGAPQRIVNAHPSDQCTQVRFDLRPTSKGAGLPTPIPAETGTMPTHERLRSDDRDDIQNRWKPSIQLDEEEAISVCEVNATTHLPPQYDHLTSERGAARAGKASGVQQRIIGRRRKLAGRLCGIA